MSTSSHQLIAAILHEAGEAGQRYLIKTILVKLLYLLDVYAARENEGTILSGLKWKFLHFGPYSHEIEGVINELLTSKVIGCESATGEIEYQKFCGLGNGPTLKSLDIPGSIYLPLLADINRYSFDLAGLLNKTYFYTEPMISPNPGDYLDFSECKKMVIKDFKPIQMKPLSKKSAKKAKTKLEEITKSRKGKKLLNFIPKYDEVYFEGLKSFDSDPLPVGMSGEATINIERE